MLWEGRMALEIRPMAGGIGAEVAGIDLAEAYDAATAARLRDAWLAHRVLVFHDQHIDAEAQRRLVRCFGELQAPRSKIERKNPDVMYVANVTVDGDQGLLPEGDMEFHADQCYYENPSAGAVLYGLEVPRAGGDTMFADAAGAYAALPDAMKRRLDGVDVVFAYDYERNQYHRPGAVQADAPHFKHPAVIAHPHTGEPVLFVNRLMAYALEGLPAAESAALLAGLFDFIEQERFIYRHVWRPFDVVVWDNFSTQHARTDFDPQERRVLRRMAIKGARPAAYTNRPID
jgi:taurine dioxygenase